MIALSDVRTPHHLSAEQYYRLLQSNVAKGYQPLDSDLTAIAALVTVSFGRGLLTQANAAAVRSYIGAGTGSGSGTVTDFSAGDLSPIFTTSEATTTTTPALTFALSNAAANTFFGNGTGGSAAPTFMSAATARTALGLVIGTNVQAYDADLTSWAAITPGSGWSTLLAATKPTTLSGYGITDAQGLDATLTAFAALTIAADSLTIGTGADAFSQTSFAANTFPAKSSTGNLVAKTITDFGLSLIDDAAASNARTTLGLVIGTDVQAYDADLTSWAAITPAANVGTFLATPSSANLIAAVTDETGTGALVFANTPTLVAPLLGTPTSGILTNCSGTAASLTAGNATKLTTGRTLAITGDLTWTSPSFDGSGNVTAAGTIANSAVTLAKMANMATASVIYRKTAGSGAPEVNTLATLKTDLGVASGDAASVATSEAYTDAAIAGIPSVANGTYNPTGSNISGTTSIIPDQAQWSQVGNVVTVSGRVRVLFSAVLVPTLVQFQLDLPVASSFGTEEDCGGTGVSTEGLVGVPLRIFALGFGGSEFDFVALPSLTGTLYVSYIYTYLVH